MELYLVLMLKLKKKTDYSRDSYFLLSQTTSKYALMKQDFTVPI